MAFDQNTRNRLARFVTDARTLLTEEFTRQLQRNYGIDPTSGEVTAVDRLAGISDAERQTAELLRETAEHYLPSFARLPAKSRRDTIERIVREQAFTVLNRLCALRMAEARGLLIESVTAGYQSRGFQLYARLASAALGETGDAYRIYLFSLFDEFAVDLLVLFDRFAPEGRLFPGETALLALLDLVNHPEIEPLWAEDETIGWIYQYFNSKEERKAMRDASTAPRNSRELAVRNQFFTPRYVVEFLTDNTLGRIWYEMTKGETSLKESCRYLVRRPNEIFLDSGEKAPAPQDSTENPSQERLLRQPVYIPHRTLKDPRAIAMLDPACGSMHFGLYAFDLFERIYDEAWKLEGERGPKALARAPMDAPLHEAYPDKASFLRDVPRLIIERNIHGVDIDPRAVQIAGLSLWLRAQKSWRDQGLKPQERPQIKRTNVVCAEPMPGDKDLLEEFIARHLSGNAEDKVVAWMLRQVFDAMALAGEAGSLLKIEDEITAIVAEAKKQWRQGPKLAQSSFFADKAERTTQRALGLDASGITDATFWTHAEERIDAALKDYAAFAEGEGAYRRRLFADDAARGFAFIDLCRKRYDVVLMNPPFGLASTKTKEFIDKHFPEGKLDLAAAMVQRVIQLMSFGGVIGVLATRTLMSLSSFEGWRTQYLLRNRTLACVADLGYGVLDAAIVEAAASVIDLTAKDSCVFISCLDFADKETALQFNVEEANARNGSTNVFVRKPSVFADFPAAVMAYNIEDSLAQKILSWTPLEDHGVRALKGLNTSDDERYLRTAWEVIPSAIGKGGTWHFLAKGGEWNPYWDDIHLLVHWKDKGASILLSGGDIRNPGYYLRPGLTYPLRTTSSFGPRVLPRDCVFSTGGLAIMFETQASPLCYLGLMLSRAGQFLVEMSLGGGDSSVSGTAARNYTNGMVNRLPFPPLGVDSQSRLAKLVENIVSNRRLLFTTDETARSFVSPIIQGGVTGSTTARILSHLDICRDIADQQEQIETIVDAILQLTKQEEEMLSELMGPSVYAYPSEVPTQETCSSILTQFMDTDSAIITSLKVKIGRGSRFVTKNAQMVDRKLELIAHLFGLKLQAVIDVVTSSFAKRNVHSLELQLTAAELFSYCLGSAYGRWDIRYATGERSAPGLSDPFAPLPVCPPGMLQNDQGLPAMPGDVPSPYPLRICWPGILVDDEGHPEDIECRVREAIQVIWNERAEVIEQEACEILGVRTLREYFRKPALFFADHLQRYSKSRRQAPIYWPLSTPSGSYTLWLYYHRLTDQTLYSCVNDFVDPKLAQVRDELGRLRQKSGRIRADEKELERLTDLEQELQDFRAELLRVAAFWKPNLNDGVQITAAPLWKLFQHKPWQKRLKEISEKLEAGEYDWAHLAYKIWPERVRDKCWSDKSLAIAHDLETLYVEPPAGAKKGRGRGK